MNPDMHNATGHLTWLGWMTFVLYLAAALLCFRTAKPCRSRETAGEGRVWSWLGVILAALGLNKPVDLQTLLIELGRRSAGKEDLSAHWTGLHFLFFLVFFLFVIASFAIVWLRSGPEIRRFARQRPLATVGCAMICLYVLLRALSILSVDRMLGFDLGRIPFLWLLETGGLLLIMMQTFQFEIRNRKAGSRDGFEAADRR